MSTTNRDICIESALPVVSNNGLNTNMAVDFSNAPSAAFPAATTIGGQSVVALGNVTGTQTTGATFSVTNTGIYTGVGADQVIANSATTGVVSLIQANGLTTGTGLSISSSGTITGAGSGLLITANSATTTNGLIQVSGTGLTSGVGVLVTGGTSMTSAGTLFSANLGAATVGSGFDAVTTGVYTDTTGLFSLTANAATTGSLSVINGLGLTSGKGIVVNATAATLTTGFYFAANDAALNVFTVGANGHLTSNQTTAPTIVVSTQAGITAAAVTAGSTDTVGNITTTGTSTGGTIITLTFNKTYTVAPKAVMVTETNAAAVTGGIYTSATATTAVFTIPVASGATPSFSYFIIA